MKVRVGGLLTLAMSDEELGKRVVKYRYPMGSSRLV